LFYTTAQIGGFYASDDVPGNSDDPYFDPPLVDFSALEDVPEFNDPSKVDGCDYAEEGSMCKTYMEVIRRNSYFHSIRAVAALYKLFEETAKQQAELTVVIDRVVELECHDDLPIGCESGPDYFVKLLIGDTWFRNEGDQVLNAADIAPGWAFARDVGLTGPAEVKIELWDEDEDPNPDDLSDIYTDPDEERALWLTIDLASCMAGADGAVSGDMGGACGVQLTSAGDDSDRSQIWFRILAPNAPPVADAGPDQTVDEGDLVTLSGSFTDPNAEDTHTFLWHLESSTNGQAVPDATTQSLSFTTIDDGVYTFSFTVTDNHGAQGSDTVVVTAENVPPVASIDSLTDETGAEIGVDVPVALVGLEVDLAGSFTDVGTVDTHTADISWGDGNTDTDADFNAFNDCVGGVTGTLNATHIYADPGMYTITLNVTDDDTGVGTTTAQIEVVDAAGAIATVVESLTPLADEPKIQAAIDKLQGEQDGRASNGALDKLEQGNPNAALEKIKQALGYLEAAEAADPSLDLTYDKGLLALAGKSVAVGAIEEAEAVAFKPNDLLKIQQAKDLVAQGDALLAAHDYVGAVDKDQQAVRKVQNIR
jgi:PKD repeat protein